MYKVVSILAVLSIAFLIHPLFLPSHANIVLQSSPNSDFDGNGVVDFADFLLFVGQFGTRQGDGRYEAKYDLDGDGAIGFGDFLIFVSNFNIKESPLPERPHYQTLSLPDGAIARLGKGYISSSNRAVAFSPDGQYLAVASSIGVWLYDVETSQELALFTGNRKRAYSVAFSPDGTKLAAGLWSEVKVWDIATRTNIATHVVTLEYNSLLDSVAFSPDGTKLAFGDREVNLWNSTTGQVTTLQKLGETFLAFSPNGRILATRTDDNTVKLWDAAMKNNILTIQGHEHWNASIESVAFSPDGTKLAVGSWSEVKLWNFVTGQAITFENPEHRVTSVAFSPNGSTLAMALRDNKNTNAVKLWNVAMGQSTTLRGHGGTVLSVAFSPDGATLATASQDATVKFWDIATLKNIATLAITPISDPVAFSPDGSILATGAGVEVRLWDVATGQSVTTFEGHTSLVNSVAFSPDGTILASGGSDGLVKLWNISTGENIVTRQSTSDYVGFSDHCPMAFSPDGMKIASEVISRVKRPMTEVWDISTGRRLAFFISPGSSGVTSLAFSPDGSTLAVAAGSVVGLWDISTEENIATLQDTRGPVAFSPDGKILVSRPWSDIKLWDVATRTEITTLEGHEGPVESVAFSPDGTKLTSGALDGIVKLWDVATGTHITTFEGHAGGSILTVTGWVHSVAFSPDGKILASGASDGMVLLWNISE